MINSLGNSSNYNYNIYYNGGSANNLSANSTSANSTSAMAKDIGLGQSELKQLKNTSAVECATCASRTYQDGSNENVSYKAATHIDPSQSSSKVMAHEQEHVSNAYAKADENNGQVVNASVSLKSAICPECGRSYVSGGVTNTLIKYNSENPYGSNKKSSDYAAIAGMNIDEGV